MANNEGIPLHGDRSAWNTTDFAGEHARDIDDSALLRHLPAPGAQYTFGVSDGSNWIISVGMLTIASGKTLTISNTLTLAGTDGKTLTLTDGLTVQGGGVTTLSSAGAYTLTIPATGTAALLAIANTFTAGHNILTNDGIDIGAAGDNDTDLITVNVTGAPKLWWDESLDMYALTKSLATGADFIIPKTSGFGIKVDTAAPTFGWQDLLGDVFARNTGASKPTFTTYRDTLLDYQFAAGDEEYFKFHIPHDYVAGTDIFLHFHWSHTGTFVTGGTLTLGYEASYAKGHNQAAFPASVSGSITGTPSTTQYQHIISEKQLSAGTPDGEQLDSDDLEPDGVIIMRGDLTANDLTVSEGAVPDPFIHFVDIHYQSTNIGTKDKVPDFYS